LNSTASVRTPTPNVASLHLFLDSEAPRPIEPMSSPSQLRWRPISSPLGRALVRLLPERASRLADGELPPQMSTLDRMLLAGLVETHKQRGSLDELHRLHTTFWASDEAARMHRQFEPRLVELRESQAEFFDTLACIVDLREPRIATACEIGCGAGLVIRELADRLADVPQFIGLDLSATQTQLNQERFGSSRLRFATGDVTTWLAPRVRPDWLCLFFGGVCEYLPRERLLALLRSLAGEGWRAGLIALCEPVADHHDLLRDAGSQIYGDENTWSHSYPLLLQAAGFEILYRNECWLGMQRYVSCIARGR
jgi:SAM-dependent methyltransferase